MSINTVWLIASSSRVYRVKKSHIISLSIPDACNEIEKTFNLRMCSNLLYGVSLAYNHQLAYFLGDLMDLKGRLQHQQLLSRESGLISGIEDTSCGDVLLIPYLEDDRDFDIGGFFGGFDDLDVEVGRFTETMMENGDVSFDISTPRPMEVDMVDFELEFSSQGGGLGSGGLGSEGLISDDFGVLEESVLGAGECGTAESGTAESGTGRSDLAPAPTTSLKRKYSLIDDQPTVISPQNFQQYHLSMVSRQISKLKPPQFIEKSLTVDSAIEYGRNFHQIPTPLTSSFYDIEDYYQPEVSEFDFSFSNLSDISSNHETRIHHNNEDFDSARLERMMSYLNNIEGNIIGGKTMVGFDRICPKTTTKNLAAMTFGVLLELASEGHIEFDMSMSELTICY